MQSEISNSHFAHNCVKNRLKASGTGLTFGFFDDFCLVLQQKEHRCPIWTPNLKLLIGDITMMTKLETIAIAPTTSIPRYAVVWLHGLGASGDDFVPVAEELALPESAGVKFIFPAAPMRAVTINQRQMMPAWYDIIDLDLQQKPDIAGIDQSVAALENLLDHITTTKIPAEKIFLAGFSQGGVIAVHTALRSRRRLAGVIAISAYLPAADKVQPTNLDLPVFIGHGLFDPIVPLYAAQQCKQQLQDWGFNNISWHTYPMAHTVCKEEIGAMRAWLLNNMV